MKSQFQSWLGRRPDGFQRLQRIGYDLGAIGALVVGGAQKSGWLRAAFPKALRDFINQHLVMGLLTAPFTFMAATE